jgi:peptide-methionine (S)-S-oxide reductase
MSRKIAWSAALVMLIAAGAVLAWYSGMFAAPEPPVAGFGGNAPKRSPPADSATASATATFGAGCFWCTEAVFQRLKGVHAVTSGYSGGHVKNPTYEEVCSKTTGHAEVVQIRYDPDAISFTDLLEVFWKTHDPTTPNQQGHDKGPQYRSAIFYHNDEQRDLAQEYKRKLDASGAFAAPIVTEIVPFVEFYAAEEYHQNFFVNNPRQAYCSVVIRPKLEKFEKVFKEKLKVP